MRLDDILDAVHEDQEKCGGENPTLWDAILEVCLPAFFSLKAHSPCPLAEIFLFTSAYCGTLLLASVGEQGLFSILCRRLFPYLPNSGSVLLSLISIFNGLGNVSNLVFCGTELMKTCLFVH